jgi:hypothetical protein
MERQRAALRVAGGVFCIIAGTVAIAAPGGVVPPPVGPSGPPRAHGIMLYLSQPIGGGGGAAIRPKFGFRVEQLRMAGNTGDPESGDPMQHRPLVGWQMEGSHNMSASDMRVQLGNRMSYDVMRREFGSQGVKPPTMALAAQPAAATRSPTGLSDSKSFASRPTETGGLQMSDPYRQTRESSSMVRDIAAAAIATFKSSRPNLGQARVVQNERPAALGLRDP